MLDKKFLLPSTVSFIGFLFLVSMDSRSYTFKGQQTFIIEKSKFEINLIHPNNFDFFETLRKKLNWGLDLRN